MRTTAATLWDIELASVNAAGTDSTRWLVVNPVISPDGTKVVFMTNGNDFGPSDSAGGSPLDDFDLYIRDLTAQQTTLLTANADGTDGAEGGGFSSFPEVAFSDDSTKVAFVTDTASYGPLDTDGLMDVYVRDLTAATTTLVSDDLGHCGTGAVSHPIFGPDGRSLVFATEGSDGAGDVFLHDLVAGTTTLLAPHQTPDGCAAAGQRVFPRSFSPVGANVALDSTSSDFGAVDTNDANDAYLVDVASRAVTLVSTNAAGTDSANASTSPGPFSPDGGSLLLHSGAGDLGAVDTNNDGDIYLKNLVTGSVTLISVNAAGDNAGNGVSVDAEFSPDGSKIAFTTVASNLGPTDSPRPGSQQFDQADVYLRDLEAETTQLLSANAAGTDSGNGSSSFLAGFLDDDHVVFSSQANDLGPKDSGRSFADNEDLYVHDVGLGRNVLVSVNADDTDSGNAGSGSARVAQDGSTIAFESDASNLGPVDSPKGTMPNADIYVARYRGDADLSLGLGAAPDPVPSGGRLSYDVEVTNDGPDTARHARVVTVLPEGATYVAAIPGAGSCSVSPDHRRVVVCTLGDLEVGASVPIAIDVDVTASAGTSLTAAAVVGSDTVDLTPGNDQDEVVIAVG